MSVEDAYEFLKDNKKISKKLKAMLEVGLPYLSLGQPLSTLSGGERQRVKLAKELDKKGNIYNKKKRKKYKKFLPFTHLYYHKIPKISSLAICSKWQYNRKTKCGKKVFCYGKNGFIGTAVGTKSDSKSNRDESENRKVWFSS